MAKNKFDIAAFCNRMEKHVGGQDGEAKLFWKALSFAVSAHEGQKRKSGEAYVSHPCLVAQILIEEMGVQDPETLAAAVLHDTMEDVPEVTNEVIGELFGKNVESIVEGCTKISEFYGDKQAFYKIVHRKIFSGAASRIEVMLVKLADRLHNLRTLQSMPKHKRQKIADETLDIYAPMAKVLGLFKLKRELYNLALQYKFPKQSQKLNAYLRKLESSSDTLEILENLKKQLDGAWINYEISSRVKGLWAYYDQVHKVLVKYNETPQEILIATDDIQSCYRVLGIVNQTYPPIMRTIRDFIANPKPTGYQSIHVRTNIKGQNYLFKIRTREILRSGRSGIISEWALHRKVPIGFEKEIREMFDILGSVDEVSYREIIAASGKKEIYTYTPKGDSLCLPINSTVLDFAFKIHTEIGRRCSHATIRNIKKGPDSILRDGDRIEIVCQKKPVRFDPTIQERCQTPRARSELSKMFRLRREALAKKIGKSILLQELKRYGIPAKIISHDNVGELFDLFDVDTLDAFHIEIGMGRLLLNDVVKAIKNTLYAGKKTLQKPTGILNRFDLSSLDPACIKLSRCCNPIPTEKGLIGLLSERGLSVHDKNCEKLKTLKIQREDVIELRWKLKETDITKPQAIYFLKELKRSRMLMLLSVAPKEMVVHDIISLTHVSGKKNPWEVNFSVDNLYGLRNIINHFKKSKLDFDFSLEQ